MEPRGWSLQSEGGRSWCRCFTRGLRYGSKNSVVVVNPWISRSGLVAPPPVVLIHLVVLAKGTMGYTVHRANL